MQVKQTHLVKCFIPDGSGKAGTLQGFGQTLQVFHAFPEYLQPASYNMHFLPHLKSVKTI